MKPSFRSHAIATLVSRAIAALVLTLAAVGPLILEGHAFSSGPPAGFTNAPFEANCTACHDDFNLDSGAATFTISTPLTYVPGSTNFVRVEFGPLTPPSVRHGFQITARDGAETPSGGWQTIQAGFTKNALGSAFHHEHTSVGSHQLSWTMNWIAPASLPNGPVTFYACGNEGNGNMAPSGDRIYSARAKIYQALLTAPTAAWPIGTTRTISLSAPSHGGELGVIVPSDDPTPVNLGGPFDLEVNPFTGFFALALQNPQIFQNLQAPLSASGQMTAVVAIPNVPALIGLPLHFAGITADGTLSPTEVSNRITVKFQ